MSTKQDKNTERNSENCSPAVGVNALVIWLNGLAGKLYLDALRATDFPEQAPEYKNAKWYDMLWLIIPILGFILFIESVRAR